MATRTQRSWQRHISQVLEQCLPATLARIRPPDAAVTLRYRRVPEARIVCRKDRARARAWCDTRTSGSTRRDAHPYDYRRGLFGGNDRRHEFLSQAGKCRAGNLDKMRLGNAPPSEWHD